MTQPDDALRRIEWTEAFPFTRMFRATRCATAMLPLFLCCAAIAITYAGGRLLDVVWIAAGGGISAEAAADFAGAQAGTVPEMLERLRREAAFGQAMFNEDAGGRSAGTGSQPAATPVRGPFAVLLSHLQFCFAAATHATAAGRIGLEGGPYGGAPSLLGAAGSALDGMLWLATQRPFYTLLFTVFTVCVLAYFGGATCRFVAVRLAADEDLTLDQAAQFANEKWMQLAGAPLLLIAAFIAVGLALTAGGIVGAIPWLGELFVGLIFPITLIGGIALAAIAVALLAGFPLIWPTIAVEGSDAADGLLKSGGYVRSRPWSAGFMAILLLGAASVAGLVARGLAMLTLKLTHSMSGLGVSFFGYARSSGDEGLKKLDGMWAMPPWRELNWLPSLDGEPFWGRFGNGGDLNWSETLGMWLIMIWVFAWVGLVGAYLLSFLLSGATGMYLVLRREVDGVDPREIFYEQPDWDSEPPAAAAGAQPPATPAEAPPSSA